MLPGKRITKSGSRQTSTSRFTVLTSGAVKPLKRVKITSLMAGERILLTDHEKCRNYFMEHTSITLESALQHVIAVKGSDFAPFVRVPRNKAEVINLRNLQVSPLHTSGNSEIKGGVLLKMCE